MAFEDGSFDETLRWNDLIETFELSDDLSIAGELSIAENMLFFRNGAAIDLVDSESMHFNTNLLTDTDLTVSGDLTVLGASATRIRNGRVEVGDGAVNVDASQSGDLFVENDLTINGILYATTISGVENANATMNTSFGIDKRSLVEDVDLFLYFGDDTDDYAHYLGWNDGRDENMLSDDLNLPNTLQVSKEMRVAGSDESRFTNGRVYIGSSDPSLLASNNNDLYVSHDTEVGIDLSVGGTGFIDHNTRVQGVITVASTSRSTVSGDLYISADASITNDLSVYGSTCLGDSAADSFIVTSRGVNVADNGTVSDTDSAVRLYDDLSITGELSVAGELEVFGRDVTRFSDGRVYIGSDTPSGIANEAGDLYVQNDTEVGGSLSIGGDVSIAGVIFSDDYTAVITGNLTAGADLDVRGRMYDGAGIAIDILDDLSVSGDLTVWSSDIHLGLLDGDDDALRFSGDTERIEWDEATDDFQITDDLSLTNNLTIDGQNLYLSTTSVISDDTAAYTEFSPQADVLAIRDSAQNQELRVYDSGGAQYVTIDTDVTPDARVQVTNGNLYIQTEGNSTQYLYFTMEDSSPYIGTVGSNLGINTENNQVHIADGESLFVDRDTLTVDGPRDRLYVNALSGTHTMEVNGSARVAHDLTVSGSDIYMGSGSGSLQFADYSEKLEWQAGADEFAVTDDVSISGTLTVPGVLRVGSLESAALYNAIDTDGDLRVTAGLMDAANDLYVEGDVEVAQNLSLGGDVTIIGVVFSDDYTEIKGTLTSSDDLDVRGRIYDGNGVAIDILR